jgi:hypothetical protein
MIAANSASSSSYEVRIRPLDRRVDGPHVAAHVDPVAVGQPRVQHRHVRAQRRDPAGRLLGQAGLAHDLDVAVGLQQVDQAAPDHLMVVEKKDSDHSFFLPPNGPESQGPKVPYPRR